MRTTFHEYTRPNGDVITVEYGFEGGSPATYSPHSGACGGDDAEVTIVTAFDEINDIDNVKLTDEECEIIEAQILENPPEFDDQDYDEF